MIKIQYIRVLLRFYNIVIQKVKLKNKAPLFCKILNYLMEEQRVATDDNTTYIGRFTAIYLLPVPVV